MIRITSPEVVNAMPHIVTKAIEVISWLSMTQMFVFTPGCLAMNLTSFLDTQPLDHLSIKESIEE